MEFNSSLNANSARKSENSKQPHTTKIYMWNGQMYVKTWFTHNSLEKFWVKKNVEKKNFWKLKLPKIARAEQKSCFQAGEGVLPGSTGRMDDIAEWQKWTRALVCVETVLHHAITSWEEVQDLTDKFRYLPPDPKRDNLNSRIIRRKSHIYVSACLIRKKCLTQNLVLNKAGGTCGRGGRIHLWTTTMTRNPHKVRTPHGALLAVNLLP